MTVIGNLNSASAFHFWRVGSCVYRCRICATAAPSAGCKTDFANSLQFWRHVKDHHRMASPATYLAAFPGDPRPCVLRRSFPCGECGADVAHDLGKMTMHMLKRHSGMDLREYYDRHVAAETVREQKVTKKPLADNPTKTNALQDLKSVAKPAEVASATLKKETNAFGQIKEVKDTDSDDGKPLIRMRSGRKRKGSRKMGDSKEETRFDENSDSEPIISDEEERAFTYQSTSKRPCTEGVTKKKRPLNKIDDDLEPAFAPVPAQLMRVTEEPLANKCTICKKTFKRPGNVTRHMQSAHNRKGKDTGDSGNDSMGLSGSESNMSDGAGAGQAAAETGSFLGMQTRVVAAAPKIKAVKRVAVPGKTPPPPPLILNHKSEWYDGCAFVCAVCAAQSSSKDTMRSHCIKIHHDGLKFTAVSSALYKCKICSEDVIHEKEALRGHFMTLHNRRLASYFNDFEDTQREARSREKEEKRRLSREKTMKRMEAEAARTEAEKRHKGPKCPMGMCGMLLGSVEEAVAHVGEVHGIAEDDVMTRRSVMNKVEAQLKWRELKISTA